MSIFSPNGDLDLIPAELASVGSDLEAAVERFGLRIAKEAAKKTALTGRAASSAVPSASVLRPVRHRVALPHRPHGAAPRSLVDRRGTQSPLAAAVAQRTQRVAAAIQERLLALRRNVAALPQSAERRLR